MVLGWVKIEKEAFVLRLITNKKAPDGDNYIPFPPFKAIHLVSRVWISINVVRLDVEGHQANCFQGRRVNCKT